MRAWVSLWSAADRGMERAIDCLDGHADGFHIDVMDGRFVSERLFGVQVVQSVRDRVRTSLVDVHLLVAEAEQWIESTATAGADLITIHTQSCRDPVLALRSIEDAGARPAVAI